MAITKTTYPERVLITLRADGSVRGAHQESLEVVDEDGVTIHARQLPAAALDAATLASVLPDAASALAAVAAAQATIDDLRNENKRLNSALAAAGTASDADGFEVMTPVALRLRMLAAGIRSADVLAVINAIADDTERERAMTFWDYSLEYHRSHPLIAQIGGALGLTPAQIDALWTAPQS